MQEDLGASFCLQQHADISQIYLITNLGRWLSHAFEKKEQMSKSVSLRFGLWTLVLRTRAALFEYMQFVRVLENITFCSLFTISRFQSSQ